MICTRLTQIYRISNLLNIVFCFAAVVFERVRIGKLMGWEAHEHRGFNNS